MADGRVPRSPSGPADSSDDPGVIDDEVTPYEVAEMQGEIRLALEEFEGGIEG